VERRQLVREAHKETLDRIRCLEPALQQPARLHLEQLRQKVVVEVVLVLLAQQAHRAQLEDRLADLQRMQVPQPEPLGRVILVEQAQ
jgi:hypothetical protein